MKNHSRLKLLFMIWLFLEIIPDCCVFGFGRNKKSLQWAKSISKSHLLHLSETINSYYYIQLGITIWSYEWLGNFSNKMCDFSIKWTKRHWPPPKNSLAANHLTFQNKNWRLYFRDSTPLTHLVPTLLINSRFLRH